ncbi:DUF982 domain-containing protein [Rhizobium mesoamericanum]|uniref:DUF982 domain-containing protein n=1 Tax=Rhizobium mesoamericanum STM3625 TaxID=1211777 RepID=K0PTJ0_9HYPH|nr:DUF982 domain-containing protein [Rhizobium mesoamericanum]CCM77138.1 conserved hypothetical protein [Rhizobium mesoamericanum STM3625]
MAEYIGEHISIRDCIVCVEKRNGVNMRRHSTLADLAYSLLYRWPEDHRGKEWVVAQTMCLEAMEGPRDPEQARAAFVAAAMAAEMLMVKEEYIQQRPERRPTKGKRGQASTTL